MTVLSAPIETSAMFTLAFLLALAAGGCGREKPAEQATIGAGGGDMHRFVVINPGHFHAALVFKRSSYEGISPEVGIYAPVDEDFTDHMARVVPFNNREKDPAKWRYRIYLGEDFRDAVFRERFGDIVILSGKNNEKIDYIKACVDSGFHVLSDKPWLIDAGKFPLLETILDEAEAKGLVAYDIMTERYEITSILQRLIASREPVFGTVTRGTPDDPAVVKSSVHHLSKVVAGRQLKRPWWFFDTSVQGEGLVDITTHLVDLVFWILFPDDPIDYRTEIEVVSSSHWPTVLTAEQYGKITLKPSFPPQFELDEQGRYPYYCNGNMTFRLRGVHCKVEVVWNYEAPKGAGDTHYSIIKGSKAHILILQGKEQNYRPELYVQPAPGADAGEVGTALKSYIASLAAGDYPGLSVVEEKDRWRIDIPDKYRVGHEAHFGQVTDRFLEFLSGEPMPAWEKANMLAKYYVTTRALEMCR